MADGERALLVKVTGRVQGVGYRLFTQHAAERLGIKGWVVNRIDGSVETALLGEGGALADLVGQLRQGPPAAHVDGVDVQSTDRGRIAEVPDGGYAF